MNKANYHDKSRLVDILTQSFKDNRSVNYIIKQDKYKLQRIDELMNYSFKLGNKFGKTYVSNDRNACAIVIYPDRKRTTSKSMLWDIQFILKSIGIGNIRKAIKREAAIKKFHPEIPFTYLWFIGTEPSEQGKGIGTALMKKIISESEKLNRPIYLETSTESNIPWYQKFGFKIYQELDFGYKLYCMKLE
jgi:ribosomal protein S18 acetylase RimI-like enzyme